MNDALGIGIDLDDVIQCAASSAGQRVVLPALHLRMPLDVRQRRKQKLDLPARFAGAALALAEADACGVVGLDVKDTYELWRQAAKRDLTSDEAESLRCHLRDLVDGLQAGGAKPRVAVTIPDPAEEVAQERWMRVLAGIGQVHLVWRPVLAALGLVSRPGHTLPESFTLVAAELGWGVLRANVLRVERDPKGLHVPERRRPGVEVSWDGAAPPPPEKRVRLAWIRRPDGCLVQAAATTGLALPEMAKEVQEAAEELAEELKPRLDPKAAGPVLWLVEGALAGVPCGAGRLGGAVVRGLRRALPEPENIEIVAAEEAMVAHGAAECARRLAFGLPAWWDALPQLEINRRNAEGIVEFVPLVHAPRIAGGTTYTHEVTGFALPEGAQSIIFVLLHEYHPTARRLEQPLNQRLSDRISVKLVVSQKPASGRARVDVVPVEPTPHFRPVQLNWNKLSDTGWDRETALRKLQATTHLSFPSKTPVPAGLYHWRRTRLPEVLRRFLRTATSASDYDATVSDCLNALRATCPPDESRRVGGVSSDGEPDPKLGKDERRLLEDFRAKLDRDIRTLPHGHDTRRRLVLAGAWLYAGAPPAVHEDLRLAFRRRDYGHGTVQAAGRSLSDEPDVRLFFERCAEVFRENRGNTDWTKALGQILIYREDACLWFDAEKARLCLYGALRELERALDERDRPPRPQIFNNAILALLGLLRVRRHIPAFLFGEVGDPVPEKVGQAIRKRLDELARRLDPVDRGKAESVREVLRHIEGQGTDQLIAARFDE